MNRIFIVSTCEKMEFPGFRLLLFAIFCIAIAMGKSIDCGQSSFLNSKSIACRTGYGGANMQPWTGGGGGGGGGNGGTAANGGGNEAESAADGAAGAMSAMSAMAPAMMRTAQQAMGTIMDMMTNMNPMG